VLKAKASRPRPQPPRPRPTFCGLRPRPRPNITENYLQKNKSRAFINIRINQTEMSV